MQLNKEETALVLAGLRLLQEEMIDGGTKYLSLPVLEILNDADIGEGAVNNIDTLCEKVNTDNSHDQLLDALADCRDALSNWVEIAEDHDKRDTDDSALDAADELLRKFGKLE